MSVRLYFILGGPKLTSGLYLWRQEKKFYKFPSDWSIILKIGGNMPLFLADRSWKFEANVSIRRKVI